MYISSNELTKNQSVFCNYVGVPLKEDVSFFNFYNAIKVKEDYLKDELSHRGLLLEQQIKNMFYLIDNIGNVSLSNRCSYLDSKLGVDLFFNFKDNIEVNYGIQIKADLTLVQTYMNHKRYDEKRSCLGILWVDDFCNKLDVLHLISNWINQPIKEDVYEIINLHNKLIGKTIPIKYYKLSSFQMNALKLLNLAELRNNEISFI